jgi:hypothetical protein
MALHCSSGRDKSVKCDTSKVTLQRSTAQEDGYLISRGPLIMRATSIRIPSGCYRLISPRHAQPLAMFADHPFSGRDLPTLSIAIARGRRWLDEVVAGTVTSGGCFAAIAHSRLWQILLQKSPSSLCEIEICNDRIGARAPLNRCCAFAPDLESMLRDKNAQNTFATKSAPSGPAKFTRSCPFSEAERKSFERSEISADRSKNVFKLTHVHKLDMLQRISHTRASSKSMHAHGFDVGAAF